MSATAAKGYSFVEKPPQRYICSICRDLQDSPVIVDCCGQHFCEKCLKEWLSHNKQKSCPHCKVKNISYFVNKQQIRDINDLPVFCFNKSKGCDWVGTVGTLQEHLAKPRPTLALFFSMFSSVVFSDCEPLAHKCQYVEAKCPKKCKLTITRGQLATHLTDKCLCRPYSCEHCRLKGTYHTITGECGEFGPCREHGEGHYSECDHYPVQCPNGCFETIRRKDLPAHQDNCPLEPVECTFSEVGCQEELVRKDLDNHLATRDHHHLLLMVKAFKELKTHVVMGTKPQLQEKCSKKHSCAYQNLIYKRHTCPFSVV